MNKQGVAYNMEKSNASISKIVKRDSFPEEYTYFLPGEELASKYIAISAYNYSFSINRVSEMVGYNYLDRY